MPPRPVRFGLRAAVTLGMYRTIVASGFVANVAWMERSHRLAALKLRWQQPSRPKRKTELGFFADQDLPGYRAERSAIYGGLLQRVEPRQLRESGVYGCGSGFGVREDFQLDWNTAAGSVLASMGVLAYESQNPHPVAKNATRVGYPPR